MSMSVLSIANFFSIPAKEYEHFTLTYAAAKTITTVVLAICLGVILAALYNFYIRRVPGGVVRLLLSREALSPETALTAAELGLLDAPFALWELLRGVSLRHIVSAVTAQDAKEGEKTPAEAESGAGEENRPHEKKRKGTESEFDAETRFYIPEDKKYRAEQRFSREGNGAGGLALTCGLTIVLGFVLIKLIPVVLTMIDNFM